MITYILLEYVSPPVLVVALCLFLAWRKDRQDARRRRSPGRSQARLAETVRLAQNDGRWDDPKRRGEAVRAAEKWQRQLDSWDRDRRAR